MYSLTIDCSAPEAELRAAELWDAGCCGIQEEDLPGGHVRLRAFFDSKPDLPGEVYDEPDTDWEAATRAAWPARKIGCTLYVAADWDDSPTPPDCRRLTIHPGMALGTGDHPATQLSLTALERHLRDTDTVLDLGCGSGILGAGALVLGARRVIGCDIDLPSILVARDHVTFPLFAGSLRSVRSQSIDLVVANLNAASISTVAEDLARVARRAVILSGFRESEAESFHVPGFAIVDRLSMDQWACLALFNDEPS